jgi:hypothetical protein
MTCPKGRFLNNYITPVLKFPAIFVLKFGAWRMSVFATDRRYSDNGILVFSLLRFVIAAVLHVKLSAK